ncbi:fungal-specific transcription factor domain-domain-containing protein [Aspergillus welwitschiae]|uniref:Fungal-specific transcription factor domain-domain-containing protein n=2 Tax=Aspergillus TaxID=5052 RepID=A0A3F3PSD4_9EURO|nr:fungal-specific transcription factor domain-domain-containing protein [Aspergillus welwitschiae]RDH29672.1 fungal-specific transcription factor domain-domain-containing protein [Aspergillus welwitschiae]
MDRGTWSIPLLPATGTSSSRQAKRRKIAVACGTCRSRKVRCDGQKPACGPCLERAEYHGVDLNCVYSRNPADRSASSKEAAIQRNQRQRSTQTQRVETQQLPSFHLQNGLGPSSYHQPETISNDCGPHLLSSSIPCTATGPQRQANSAEGVNAMVGEVAADERYPTQGFFGSSSAGGFMRQIRVAVGKEVPSSGASNPQSSLFDLHRSKGPSTSANINSHVLPPRRMADHLMQIYWEFVFPLYPFFDREQLSAEYLRIWNGEGPTSDEDMIMCTFNVIFALCCQLSENIKPENRASTADSFFSRAKQLIQFDPWQPGSTAFIQCLLLMSQYLQSTDHADQCWMVTGMAIRSAQSLGLHLPETSSRLASSQGKELARRLWHGCVLMDRVVALTLGRPAMISKEAAGAVPLPTMVDEEVPPGLLDAESHFQDGETERPSFMTFYAKCLELYEILNDILLSLYSNSNTPPDRPEDHHNYYFRSFHEGQVTVTQLDYALTLWSQSLPKVFRCQSTPLPANDVISRQRIVLRLRLLHIRMVLLRPILSKYCDLYNQSTITYHPSEDSLPQRFALQCSIVCVKSAQDLIDMTYTNLAMDNSTNTIGLLPAWWYNILYIYTASTVLIAGRLHQAILSELHEDSISRTWQRALDILRKYQSYSSSAQRCIVALELLDEKVTAAIDMKRRGGNYHGSVMPAGNNNSGGGDGSAASPRDVSLGEGLSAAVLDTWDLPDFFDMSWLNSVPSSLF